MSNNRVGVVVLIALCFCVLAGAVHAQVPQILYYKLNEGSGTTTANAANPGQGSNPATFTTGPASWAGTGQLGASHVQGAAVLPTGYTLSLSGTTPWTIECWVNIAATTTLNYVFGDGTFRCFTGGVAPNGGFVLRGNLTDLTINGGADGTWHHIAFVYDGAGTTTSYLDGAQSGQNTAQAPTAAGTFTVGNSASAGAFTGQFDEFRFWSVARSQAEISAAMNTELPLSNSTILSASSAGGALAAPVTNKVVLDMVASTYVSNNDLNSVTFARAGSVADSDISAVVLYRDNNNDGAVDGGDTQLGTSTLTSSSVTFSGSPLQALTSGASTRLLLAVNIPGTLSPGATLQFSATAATWSGGTDLTNYPQQGGQWIVVDPNIPYYLYYKFNEATGTSTTNSAVPGGGTPSPTFTGTVNWVTPGKLGASGIATGTVSSATGQLETGWAPSLPSTQPWTLETWFRTSYTGAVYLAGDTAASTWRLYFNTGKFYMYGGGFPTTVFTTAGGLYDGQWHHLGFVYDGAGTAQWYIDGALDSTHTGLAPSISGTNFRIGSYLATNYWRGDIDEFRFWNVARTQSEIVGGLYSELPITDSQVLVANTTKSKLSTPANNVVVLDLNSYTFVNNKDLNSVSFSRTGGAADTDFSGITLYLDNITTAS